MSLRGPESYAHVAALLGTTSSRIGAVVLTWALAHHLLAGIRHLLSDIDVGSRLSAARRSAWIVNLSGLAIAALAAGAML